MKASFVAAAIVGIEGYYCMTLVAARVLVREPKPTTSHEMHLTAATNLLYAGASWSNIHCLLIRLHKRSSNLVTYIKKSSSQLAYGFLLTFMLCGKHKPCDTWPLGRKANVYLAEEILACIMLFLSLSGIGPGHIEVLLSAAQAPRHCEHDWGWKVVTFFNLISRKLWMFSNIVFR